MNLAHITKVIHQRRSVVPNLFSDENIDKAIIEQLLSNAHTAPNHKKTRPWRFMVFSGDSRAKLSEYLAHHYKLNTPVEQQSEIQQKKISEKPLKSFCSIVIIMHRDPAESLPEWEEVAAVACAVQNLWLSATAAGLAGFWATPKAMLEANEFLELKENERCLGVFYLGKPTMLPPIPDRGDYKEHVKWME